MKVAGAAISWGVSELPAWGHRMAPERVLGEMRGIGLEATELGPPGFLPDEPGELREMLEVARLELAAGFLACCTIAGIETPRSRPVGAVIRRLRDAGYKGWYVLEQDTALTAEPKPARGPVADVRPGLDFFRSQTDGATPQVASKED